MRAVFICALLVGAGVMPAAGSTYTVAPDGTGDFPNIQAAVDFVTHGDIIELTDGVFTGVGNREVSFLGKAITIRSQSGDPQTCTVDCEAAGRGFLFQSAEGPESRLEGVSIVNGWASGVYPHGYGGGIRCLGASPTLQQCIVRDCWAARGGGGLYSSDAAITATDCQFEDNTVDGGNGGAVELMDMSSAWLTGCTFSGNYGQRGGGIYAFGSIATLTDCLFKGNAAFDLGGGLHFQSGSHLTVSSSVFKGNSAGEGGALYCWDDSAEVVGCSFIANSAGKGGAINAFQCRRLTVSECVFEGNLADYGGGCRAVYASGPVRLSQCTFHLNEASDKGGAIQCIGSEQAIVNCTLCSNRALQGSSILAGWGAELSVVNSILAFSLDGCAVFCGDSTAVDLACCDIFGNMGGDWVGCVADQASANGNFALDPRFCDPVGGDFRLWNDSPCVQALCGQVGAWPVGCWDPQALAEPSGGLVPWGGLGLQVHPSPFRASVALTFLSPPGEEARTALIEVRDVLGRHVRTLATPNRGAGQHAVTWDGRDSDGLVCPAGVYVFQLGLGPFHETRRAVRLR